MEYIENEIKILDVDKNNTCKKLEAMGAKKVFDGERIFTYFDNNQKDYSGSGKSVRLTEEGKLKLSGTLVDDNGVLHVVKVFTSRKQETVDFLNVLGLCPVAEVKSHRISYELDDIDFDIDTFPFIPPFIEIDLKHIDKSLDTILKSLELNNNKIMKCGTPEIYTHYNKEYFKSFKIKK